MYNIKKYNIEIKKISALIINARLACNNVSLGESTQNHKLMMAINNMLYHGFKIIWISSNSTTNDLKSAIAIAIGDLHEKTSIIGNEQQLAANDLCLYEKLAYIGLERRNIEPNEAILISDHELISGDLSAQKALHATLIVNSPEELIELLTDINFIYLLN